MSRVKPNRLRYLQSLAEELHTQSTRVRDLIGAAHWYYDGHHKEYLLVDLLKRHLPSGMLASRGFVISPTEPESRSKEQDILVIDLMEESPVLNQGGIVVVFPRAVKAAISVKSTMDSATVLDSVIGLNSVRNVVSSDVDSRALWCGAYYYEVDEAVRANPLLTYGHIQRAVLANPVRQPVPPPRHPIPMGPDVHCSAKDVAFRLEHGYKTDVDTVVGARLLGFHCNGCATAYFLGQLLDHVAAERGATESSFSYFSEDGDMKSFSEPSRDIGNIEII